jgi:cytoskeletal protein CcmA (bactofilin family)
LSYFKQGKNELGGASAAGEPRLVDTAVPEDTSPENISTFGRNLTITGNIVSEGSVQIFGRVIGDIHAKSLGICEGAQVEGNVIAQETVIRGQFKGVIHSDSVKIQGRASVEGEIFNKSLSVEENAQFEGMARRLEKPVVAPSNIQAKSDKPVWAQTADVVPFNDGVR